MREIEEGITTLQESDPGFDSIAQFASACHLFAREYIEQSADPIGGRQVAMSALQIASGVLMAELLVAGALKPAATKRGADMAAKNFREGIKIGNAMIARVMREASKGTA